VESRSRASAAAALLAIDALAAELCGRLDDAGVGSILLKGPALAQWLYPGGGRAYEDCDLLVDPARLGGAEDVLRELDFQPCDPPPVAAGLAPPIARCWQRSWERVDLHTSFWGLTAPPSQVWSVLAAGAATGVVARRELRMPSIPARLLVVALHAAHHGRAAAQPIEDLARALAQEPDSAWLEAAALARRLGGEPPFWAAFALVPGGLERARKLDAPPRRTLEGALAAAGLPVSEGFERLARTRGLRARVRLTAAELLPSPEFMRWRYALAGRGAAGLAVSYPLRIGSVLLGVARVSWRLAKFRQFRR
jgi:Uncharacterised nucleotidyltransferase